MEISFFFIGLVALVVYFLPALIANRRTHHAAGIAVVNLFFGWTLIGWVGCLAWALVATAKQKQDRKEAD